MVRGQGSLEYVMNYSWVILLVLIVGIVLSESGVLSSGTSAGTFSGFAKVRPQLSGVSLDKNGNFQGVFTNGLGQLITVTTVGMSVSNGGECSNYAVSPASVPSGSNFIVTADTCPVDNLGDPYTLT
ncbi:MAG: hypothetical protein KKD39_01365, partial [Candidatus Altiarchaeota archaeon]|nr:hypothetical protein [Candidatus Altiarchaeota archaeon]